MSDFKTIEAAEALLASSTRDTWCLADAVLVDVPEMPKGQRTDQLTGVSRLDDALAQVADAVTGAGITTPNGEPYSADSLKTYRNTAIAWPQDARENQASYRTHQECSSAVHPKAAILHALCAIARGERVNRPAGCSAESWKLAVAKIDRNRRFPVSANVIRIAMDTKPNIPPANPTNVATVLGHIAYASTGLRAFVHDFLKMEPTAADRRAIGKALQDLIDDAQRAYDVVTATFDDDALATLLDSE